MGILDRKQSITNFSVFVIGHTTLDIVGENWADKIDFL